MNIYSEVRNDVIAVLDELLDQSYNAEAITVEPPREKEHGHIATNAAMVVAKSVKKNPRDVAQTLAEKLEQHDYIDSVTIAGPGFININITPAKWYQLIKAIIDEGVEFGACNIGDNQKINVEYVSANPTGPMHIGHARGAVYGDVLASLLEKAGYKVTREYYINDAGVQINTLVESALLRAWQALGEKIEEIPEGLYPGDYLIPVGKALAERYGSELDNMSNVLEQEIRDYVLDSMMHLIKNDLEVMGIVHDVFSSEQRLINEGKVDQALDQLEEKDLLYKGVLEPPKGQVPEDWEPREQTLFKASEFGDDIDRPLRKSDNSYTYFASDIAYHYDKFERGFCAMVLILGADHGGYKKRLQAAVKALSDGTAYADVKIYQLVNFLQDGQPAKMSKRAGKLLTVRDVVDEVGKDVLRFMMLTRKNDMVLDFDFAKVTEQSKDNPVFYVQYAHARAHSVLCNAIKELPELENDIPNVDDEILSKLVHSDEIDLIRQLSQWPRIVESAAIHFEPHRLVFYLQELAAHFHAFWNKGKEDDSLRFIVKHDMMLTQARLTLVTAMATTIASGLAILGVTPVEEM